MGRSGLLCVCLAMMAGCGGGKSENGGPPKNGDPPPVKNGKDVTYMEFADAGRSIFQLRDMAAVKKIPFRKEGWYEAEPFAAEEEKPCTRKLRVLADGFSKTVAEQRQSLRAGEDVPQAQAVVAALVEGKLSFANHYVRCRKEGPYEVFVGNFPTEGGISIHLAWWEEGNERYPDTTLVVERVGE